MYEYMKMKKRGDKFFGSDSSVLASLRAADRVLYRIYGRSSRRASTY